MPIEISFPWMLVAVLTGGAPATDLVPYESAPIHVPVDAPVRIELAAKETSRNYLVIAGSTALAGQPTELRAHRQPIARRSEGCSYDVADTTPPEWWTWRTRRDREQMVRARRAHGDGESYVVARFAPVRGFHLFVGTDNLYDTKKYVEVRASLAAVGKHCIIYADSDSMPNQALIDEIRETYDEKVYPSMRSVFGEHRDVDRNGKFTILVTDWLNRLSDGKVVLSGFVRGADFYRDVEPPFSNRCDMLYLNASLTPGPHLRTVLAHEYTHAITFSEHTFGEYLPGSQGRDEEAWLGEAIAHLAENMSGEGWSNLDYRISTYLSEPNRYRLVVPDYFRDGLWRSHGCRGATYLFLRYCVDRFGEELLTDLSKSNLEGVDNLEVATQVHFPELFRQWSVALATAAASGEPAAGGIHTISMHGRLGERMIAGARVPVLQNGDETISVAPTSWASWQVSLAPGEACEVELSASDPEDLQVTLVRLPDDLVQVAARLLPRGDGDRGASLRLVTSSPVEWQSISWERLRLRQENPRANEKMARIISAAELLIAEHRSETDVLTEPVNLTEYDDDPVVFKAIGIDSKGRYVTAWGIDEVASTTNFISAESN